MTTHARAVIAGRLGISSSVLTGLDDYLLQHASNGRTVRGRWQPYRLLPNEIGGYSVYQITFANGATYVGSTGDHVLDCLERHFGADPRTGQPAPPIITASIHGLGTFAIVSRAVAGIPWRVAVLASGLSERRAGERERAWLAGLNKPIR